MTSLLMIQASRSGRAAEDPGGAPLLELTLDEVGEGPGGVGQGVGGELVQPPVLRS